MRLIFAEVLKLVRRRGLMIWSLLLTVGAVLVAEIIIIVLHAVNPDHHGPAGGRTNLENYTFLLAGLGNVAAIIIGATRCEPQRSCSLAAAITTSSSVGSPPSS